MLRLFVRSALNDRIGQAGFEGRGHRSLKANLRLLNDGYNVVSPANWFL